jgi:hypothetical protein
VPWKSFSTLPAANESASVFDATKTPPVKMKLMDFEMEYEVLHVSMLSDTQRVASQAVNPIEPTMLCCKEPKTPEKSAQNSSYISAVVEF